jgi:hypothetical protein
VPRVIGRRLGRTATLVATALLVACASGPVDDDRARAEGLASAERAFAAAASTSGVRAAFLGALAEHATLFRPGPVDGRGYTASRPDPRVLLEWQPQRVTVSASGELGYSTGPYRLAPASSPDRRAYGQFSSVWRRAASGRWEVLIDLGIGHPGPQGWDLPLEIVPAGAHAAEGSVVAAEAAFAGAARSVDARELYRQFGSTRLRLLRDGYPSIDGLAGGSALPDATARREWTLSDSGEAGSRDLAWTMGRYRPAGPDAAPGSGFYVRVWHVEGLHWKILSEVLAPLDEAAG